MRRIAPGCLLLALLMAMPVVALEVQVGHVASELPEPVLFEVDGQALGPALTAGQFSGRGIHNSGQAVAVRAYGAESGKLLAATDFAAVAPGLTLQAVLYRRQDGLLVFTKSASEPPQRFSDNDVGQLLVLRALDEQEGHLDYQYQCQPPAGGPVQSGLDALALGGLGTRISANEPTMDCSMSATLTATGESVSGAVRLDPGRSVLQVFARTEADGPLRLFNVVAGQVLAAGSPDLESASRDRTRLWLDRSRPGQGALIAENRSLRRTEIRWLSFDADGEPRWWRLEGPFAAGAGRRDLNLYAVAEAAGQLIEETVGSARLVYLDCNQAELRVVDFGGGVRTVLLERALPQVQCLELNP